MSADAYISDQGSIILIRPVSPGAQAWIDENIGGDAQFFANSLVVEHRYADSVIEGMINDGLDVDSE